MNTSNLISIIVPVYNTSAYLEKMIDSIISQTYHNWELLLIDDGSTDNSLEICKGYSQKYNNIFIFHQKNSGPSSARNLGIDNAKGDYICFVDSDDWVDSDYLEIFINNIDENTLVIQDYKRIINDGQKIIRNVENYQNIEFNLPKDLNNFIKDKKNLVGGPCNKIFNREILLNNNLKFHNKITMCEDEVFYYKYLTLIERVVFVEQDPYNYVGRHGSLTSKNAKFESEFLYCSECNKFYHYILSSHSTSDSKEFFIKNFSKRFNQLLRIIIYWEGKYSKEEKISFLKKMHKEYSNSLKYLKGDTFLKKIDYFLFKNKLFNILDLVLQLKTKYN